MYVCVDIETLGLNTDNCDIIEVGAVIDDWKTPIEELPKFHCYLLKDNYRGEAFAMSMHATILRRIATKEQPYRYIDGYSLDDVLSDWLLDNGYGHLYSGYDAHDPDMLDGPIVPFMAAGKNYAGFDHRFLSTLPNFGKRLRAHHRVLDPASLFFDPKTMDVLPGLKQCMEIAGISTEVNHTAVDDALDVIRCIRWHYSKQ